MFCFRFSCLFFFLRDKQLLQGEQEYRDSGILQEIHLKESERDYVSRLRNETLLYENLGKGLPFRNPRKRKVRHLER